MPSSGCQPSRSLDQQLQAIVKPYRFSIAAWEVHHILTKTDSSPGDGRSRSEAADKPELVTAYFSLVDQIDALKKEIDAVRSGPRTACVTCLEEDLQALQEARRALRGTVEEIIGYQVREALRAQGIYNPADRYFRLRVSFPPVYFTLDRPPNLLVISPKERIESLREITLRQDLSVETMEEIEAQVEALGMSALAVELGGFGGTYPTFVLDDATVEFTLGAVAEEWLHQYLAFTPLGFRYLLDVLRISPDYEIATMNETVAGIVQREITEIALDTFYPEHGASEPSSGPPASTFDFNREMREIRVTVDALLADGEIERAAEYMEERRLYLATQGYHIRKLNQAYFAFYGTYAAEPTSVSPIGVEMRRLRSQSESLGEFLNHVAAMTSRQDLLESLETSGR